MTGHAALKRSHGRVDTAGIGLGYEDNGNCRTSRARDPGKGLFRIGEVSRLTATKAFVLRYWETEFPTLEPVKSPSGHRLYRREDIETVFEIKRLLYDEGFTIAGARKHLEEQAKEQASAQRLSSGVEESDAEAFALGAASAPVPRSIVASRACIARTSQISARSARRTPRCLDPSRTRVIR